MPYAVGTRETMSKNPVPHLITITRPAPITDLPDPIRLVIEALPRATYVRGSDA